MREVVITRDELFSLPEYSCSTPTGTTIGKRWRRDVNAYRLPVVSADRHEWMIGEYVDIGSDVEVGIQYSWAVDENHKPHRGIFQ